MRPTTATLAALLVLLLAGGCSRPAPGPAGGERVESPELGVAVASLPQGFRVTRVAADVIVLEGRSSLGPGEATIVAGPQETGGVNLIEVVKGQKAAFEALPGASYLGNRELGTPIGTAFTARARYADPAGGREVEETKVFAIHPWGDRLLTVSYRYPAGGDSQERVQQLLLLLGEIEGLPQSG